MHHLVMAASHPTMSKTMLNVFFELVCLYVFLGLLQCYDLSIESNKQTDKE